MQHPFKSLILIALGKTSALQEPLSPGLWRYTYSMALKQAMVGVLWEGVKRLPEEQLPPRELLETWRDLASKISGIHQLHVQHTEELSRIFQELGLRVCLLKGTSLASLYPESGSRQIGDIDVWVAGRHKATLEALRGRWAVGEVLWQECKVGFFEDTLVEVHFHPTKMYNPVLNARLQRTLERLAPAGFLPCSEGHCQAVLPGSGGCFQAGLPGAEGCCKAALPLEGGFLAVPSQRFNAVFCMAHMFRHYLEGGIGLRQMLDYYFVVRLLSAQERSEAMRDLRRLGMGRFTGSVMLVLQKAFQLEDEFLLCAPDVRYGAKLMDDILDHGNFGISDPRNAARQGETSLGRFLRKNGRVFSNVRGYPREVLWSPFARIQQYLWRHFHSYI